MGKPTPRKCYLIKIKDYHAVGGIPPDKITPVLKKEHYTPTQSGLFTINSVSPHRSGGRWEFSTVTWGAATKIEKGIVQVKLRSKFIPLRSIKAWSKYSHKEILEKVLKAYDDFFDVYTNAGIALSRVKLMEAAKITYISTGKAGKEIPDKWMLNDFGHLSIKYYKDKNHNGRLDGKEGIVADFVHSSPNTEMFTRLPPRYQGSVLKAEVLKSQPDNSRDKLLLRLLNWSHGCIHILPADMDEMVKEGYAKKGNILKVHDYTVDTYDEKEVIRHRITPYEVHFFPKDFRVVVFKIIPYSKAEIQQQLREMTERMYDYFF
ncbi:MAG: hypothetical protein AAF828_08205 [Bacteroidota bacterium]